MRRKFRPFFLPPAAHLSVNGTFWKCAVFVFSVPHKNIYTKTKGLFFSCGTGRTARFCAAGKYWGVLGVCPSVWVVSQSECGWDARHMRVFLLRCWFRMGGVWITWSTPPVNTQTERHLTISSCSMASQVKWYSVWVTCTHEFVRVLTVQKKN